MTFSFKGPCSGAPHPWATRSTTRTLEPNGSAGWEVCALGDQDLKVTRLFGADTDCLRFEVRVEGSCRWQQMQSVAGKRVVQVTAPAVVLDTHHFTRHFTAFGAKWALSFKTPSADPRDTAVIIKGKVDEGPARAGAALPPAYRVAVMLLHPADPAKSERSLRRAILKREDRYSGTMKYGGPPCGRGPRSCRATATSPSAVFWKTRGLWRSRSSAPQVQ